MKYTKWMAFTSSKYHKRIFDFHYKGSEIHLVLKLIDPRYSRKPRMEVTWQSSKFRSVKFDFTIFINKEMNTSAKLRKELFTRLRVSLAYGMNQSARPVIDRMRQHDPLNGKLNPVHNAVRTSSQLKG